MAAIRMYECDRCGKLYKDSMFRMFTFGERFPKLGLFTWTPIPGNRIYDRVCLCDDCYREFEKWWYGRKDND